MNEKRTRTTLQLYGLLFICQLSTVNSQLSPLSKRQIHSFLHFAAVDVLQLAAVLHTGHCHDEVDGLFLLVVVGCVGDDGVGLWEIAHQFAHPARVGLWIVLAVASWCPTVDDLADAPDVVLTVVGVEGDEDRTVAVKIK